MKTAFSGETAKTIISVVAIVSAVGLAISITLLFLLVFVPGFKLSSSSLRFLPLLAGVLAFSLAYYLLVRRQFGRRYGGRG
jgi:hypothetical protein